MQSIWGTYTHGNLFRALGDLRIMLEGYPYWQGRYLTAMCQFGDTITLPLMHHPRHELHTLTTCAPFYSRRGMSGWSVTA